MPAAIRFIAFAADAAFIATGTAILTGPPSAAANYNAFAGFVIAGAIIAIAGLTAANRLDRRT